MTDRSCIELQLVLNTVEGVEIMRALDEGPLTLSDMRVQTNVDLRRLDCVTRALLGHGVLRRGRSGEYVRAYLPADGAVAH